MPALTSAAASRTPGPPLIHAQAGRSARPPRPPTPPAAPGGRKWGGARGAAPSQLSLLSPEGMLADFLKPDPGRPPARLPLTWTCSLGNGRRGAGAHLGGRGQVLLPLPPQAASCSGKGGEWEAIKPSHSSPAT